MIGGLIRIWDNLLGRGEAAVTVPPLDGALCPNRMLDEADQRFALADVDCLAEVSGELVASAGSTIYTLKNGKDWSKRKGYEAEIACIASVGGDGFAVALATGEITIEGGEFDGRQYQLPTDVGCITALAVSGSDLYIANGSATNGWKDWQLDLLQRNASGSLWRINLESGAIARIADGLSYPAGIAVAGDRLVCSEAWKHRLVSIDTSGIGEQAVLYAELPGYPGRISAAEDGFWLTMFAPRSQLVEFVLREPAYRRRMIAEVPQEFWIAPKLRSGRSFYEAMQGGSVKQLGLLKPWSPTMSAGLLVKLDGDFQPVASLHSRADGVTHGLTCTVERNGRVFAAARGDGVVVSIGLDEIGDGE